MTITLERAYDDDQTDGTRVLVDRIWPRGVSKDELDLDEWNKDVAPSDELRKWFGHDPERWEEFQQRYVDELEDKPETWRPLVDAARDGELVLIFGAKDRERNNAVALQYFLENRL